MKKNKPTIAVAISGGVDSAAAAYLLKKKGYQVIGLFMLLSSGQKENEKAASAVCSKLEIPFHKIDLSKKFNKEIVNYFIESYKNGLTPNPCVKCNQLIKFSELLKQAKGLGADHLATGHYVRIKKLEVRSKKIYQYKLYRGRDREKDQSYFLYTLSQQQLSKIIFPLGNYLKSEVKAIAGRAGLPVGRKESQDICFLSGAEKAVDHNEFLKKYIKPKKGMIKTLDGEIVGEHEGLHHFTIGQRRGIRIGGIGPFYAAKFDNKNNILYVVKEYDDKRLYSKKLIVNNVNWIEGKTPALPLKSSAVIRYRHKPVSCLVEKRNNLYQVIFTRAQRAITPGQSVVFYKGNEILGGGIIKK